MVTRTERINGAQLVPKKGFMYVNNVKLSDFKVKINMGIDCRMIAKFYNKIS